ncbi:hypothetical protein M514_27694 [Trichuris suis]|uniref:Uncharacterized protein n=1 Tax=Trichuris suis TaxID=68888 RepID=A0A085MSB7_9BILA|nr:hypothetical protein M514_27694 [Trichuris suis]
MDPQTYQKETGRWLQSFGKIYRHTSCGDCAARPILVAQLAGLEAELANQGTVEAEKSVCDVCGLKGSSRV